MFETWTNKMTYITDIIENGNIIDFRQVEERIGRSPKLYLEYQVVKSAVTSYLNRHIQVDNTAPAFIFTQNNEKPSAKDFRRFMTTNSFTEPCTNRFWLNKYNISVDNNIWKLSWKTTQEVRLRELQWKILHNIYPTNILLEKMGLSTNN